MITLCHSSAKVGNYGVCTVESLNLNTVKGDNIARCHNISGVIMLAKTVFF